MTKLSQLKTRQIQNSPQRLQQIGKIKMGGKNRSNPKQSDNGTWYPPVKYDYFMLETMKKDSEGFYIPDYEAMEALGAKDVKRVNGIWQSDPAIKEIEVVFPFNNKDLIFQSHYAMYAGRTKMICRGNGTVASRLLDSGKIDDNVACTCEYYENPPSDTQKCKMNGILNVMIAACPQIGGVYTLRTGGFYTTTALQSSINGFWHSLRGNLAGIKFKLKMVQQQSTYNKANGQTGIANFPVAVIIYDGPTDKLLERASAIHKTIPPSIINEEQRLLAEKMPEDSKETTAEIVEEFHPHAIGNDKSGLNPEKEIAEAGSKDGQEGLF